jgi:hypothetical protein
MRKAQPRTVAQLEEEIRNTFRKWRNWQGQYPLDEELTYNIMRRSMSRRDQTEDERRVVLTYTWYEGRPIRIEVFREPTALENLTLIAHAVETMRRADMQTTLNMIRMLLNQMTPPKVFAPTKPTPSPPLPSSPLAKAYLALGVQSTAPDIVIEAAYRALAKIAHVDAGGSHEAMKGLNLAIELIRETRRAEAA